MTEIPGEGVMGYILYDPHTEQRFFRVYSEDKKSYVDYTIRAENIKVQILSKFVSLFSADGDQPQSVNWSTRYLNKHHHCTESE